eukprot:CAMPEP_0113610332 /NCGR_PEP_ID=MMETSP0017_2-20120614/4977_1 /TAXON_ID=2856 /ORGANISM="Cylindrotheca closterium" /LENGTH=548 /DNA_ID=CAMNT_0000519227 /DNA_START=17 /DNA_END=1663 /DNA_ORIENTATION=+ /assembly_acc=CAM_ASM_000147
MEDSDKGLFERFDDDDDLDAKDDDSTVEEDENNNNTKVEVSREPPAKAVALSMQFMKSLSNLCCQDLDCVGFKDHELLNAAANNDEAAAAGAPSELYNLRTLQRQSVSSISPFVSAPMMTSSDSPGNASSSTITIEKLMGEYMTLCQFYKVPYNSGVLTTLRYRLPSLRVGNSFHDTDMLALTELLLRHSNSNLSYIKRLDFTIPGKEGKRYRSMKFGFTSHGALALAKTLQYTKYVTQVWLPKHRIGPYGASALFWACSTNSTIEQLNLRRCRIGERGAYAFCELILNEKTGLEDVDLSANVIGHRGTVAIEKAIKEGGAAIYVNLEGNLVIPEIMNGVTHGIGTIVCLIGGYLLSDRVKDSTPVHKISCAVYTISLLVLYLSSTLYHSFFSLQHTKYIFMVLDKCAIYILIAGSYTPFMQILFYDKPIWSSGLLSFIWLCGLLGISVEAFAPTWDRRKHFSLAMYLGMGWAAMTCIPQMYERLPRTAMNMLVMGGVGYTAGVPFFVRNNNLDHAIWHLFVMAGSIFHWLCVYFYVAPQPLPGYEYE